MLPCVARTARPAQPVAWSSMPNACAKTGDHRQDKKDGVRAVCNGIFNGSTQIEGNKKLGIYFHPPGSPMYISPSSGTRQKSLMFSDDLLDLRILMESMIIYDNLWSSMIAGDFELISESSGPRGPDPPDFTTLWQPRLRPVKTWLWRHIVAQSIWAQLSREWGNDPQ